MEYPHRAKMGTSEELQGFAPCDLKSPLESDLNEQHMSELIPDARHSYQNWRSLSDIMENPATVNGGYDFTTNSQWEMPQNSLHIPDGDKNMSLDPELPLVKGYSSFFDPNKENLATLNNKIGLQGLTEEGQTITPFGSTIKGTTAMEALPTSPTLIPTSFISRSNQPKMSNINANKRPISRKNTTMGRDLKLQRFPPNRLIKHLENEFRSNDNISEDFRRKAMIYLDQLNVAVRREEQHGSPAARRFLSGEDDRTERCSFFTSSGNSSQSLTQLMNAPNFSSSFMIYSDNKSDTSAMIPAAEEPSTQFRISTSKMIYYCTYPGCVQLFKTRADWMRHEKTKQHWPEDIHMCPHCAICETSTQGLFCKFCSQSLLSREDAKNHCLKCDRAKEYGKTFLRKDKFGLHLRTEHNIFKISEDMESWSYNVGGDWPRQCGFCGTRLEDREERANHLEEHFKAGKTMTDYMLPFPFSTDSVMQHSDSYLGKDDDSDDFGGGGGDYGWAQGSMPPPQGLTYNWLGNSSASGGFTPTQNRSSSANNETQYSRPSTLVAASTDLIPYKPPAPSPRTTFILELSPAHKDHKRFNFHNSTKILETLLPIIYSQLLLISTHSTPPSHIHHQKHNPHTHISHHKLIKSLLLPLLAQQSRHDVTSLYRLEPKIRVLASLLVRECYGTVGAVGGRWALRSGGKKRQHRRQKSWERLWNSGAAVAAAALEKEFERMLVLGEECGGVGI